MPVPDVSITPAQQTDATYQYNGVNSKLKGTVKDTFSKDSFVKLVSHSESSQLVHHPDMPQHTAEYTADEPKLVDFLQSQRALMVKEPANQSTNTPAVTAATNATQPTYLDLPTVMTKLEPPNEQQTPTRGISLEALQDRSIEAVVSLLDEEASKNVRTIWAELEDEFGLQKIYAAPFPHFSYHSAERYDENILNCLAEAAADLPPFTARVSGLGVFAAPKPIVYLAMVRNTVLSHHHELLWAKLAGHAYTSNLHYHPEAWVPHITLAQGDVTSESLPAVMTYLSTMILDWEICINNIALVFANGLEQGIKQEFPLGKPADVTSDIT